MLSVVIGRCKDVEYDGPSGTVDEGMGPDTKGIL